MIDKKLLVATIITLFLGTLVIGFFHVTKEVSKGGVTYCPFSVGANNICEMTVVDHLSVLRSIVNVTIPTPVSFLLLSILSLVLICLWCRRNTLNFCFKEIKILKPKHYLNLDNFLIERAWQELFSAGILHPKIF